MRPWPQRGQKAPFFLPKSEPPDIPQDAGRLPRGGEGSHAHPRGVGLGARLPFGLING